ncbi:lipoprotein 17-related variable surface protein [Mycoplasmopsis agassizii]|uniref:lipoprotein 17-related variable surface protein n=1 Tax=Mycoplasmopsis agassizii TaxID=33922 RepID=UPI0035287FC0
MKLKKLNKKWLLLSGTIITATTILTAIACSSETAPVEPSPITSEKDSNRKILKALLSSLTQEYDAKSSYQNKDEAINALTASSVKDNKTEFEKLLKTAPKFGLATLTNISVSNDISNLSDKQVRLTLTLSLGTNESLVTENIDFTISFETPVITPKSNKEIIARWYQENIIDLYATKGFNNLLASSINANEDKLIFTNFFEKNKPQIPSARIEVSFVGEYNSKIDTSLKLKVTLKTDSISYKENGDEDNINSIDSGKVITISSIELRDLDKIKAKRWYKEIVIDKKVSGLLTEGSPSSFTKNDLIDLFEFANSIYEFKDSKIELDILSDDDYQGTLKVKVTIKKANKYFTTDGLEVNEKEEAGKVVTLTGFHNYRKNVSDWYQDVIDFSLLEVEIANWKNQLPSSITNLSKVKEIFTKPSLIKLPKSDFIVEITANDEQGTLAVKVILTANNKYYDTSGNNTSKREAGKTITISGFKKDTLKADVAKWYNDVSADEIQINEESSLIDLLPSQVTTEQLNELFNIRAIETTERFRYNISVLPDGINDYESTLKVKITLYLDNKYFKTDGESVALINRSSAGKVVTIKNLSPIARFEKDALNWYKNFNLDELIVDSDAKMYFPSELKGRDSFYIRKQIIDSGMELPENFRLNVRFISGDDALGEADFFIYLEASDTRKRWSNTYIFDVTTGKAFPENGQRFSENLIKLIKLKNLAKTENYAPFAYKRLSILDFSNSFDIGYPILYRMRNLDDSEKEKLEALSSKLSKIKLSDLNEDNISELKTLFKLQLESAIPPLLRDTFKFEFIIVPQTEKNSDLNNNINIKDRLNIELLLSSAINGVTKYYSLENQNEIRNSSVSEVLDKSKAKGYTTYIEGFKPELKPYVKYLYSRVNEVYTVKSETDPLKSKPIKDFDNQFFTERFDDYWSYRKNMSEIKTKVMVIDGSLDEEQETLKVKVLFYKENDLFNTDGEIIDESQAGKEMTIYFNYDKYKQQEEKLNIISWYKNLESDINLEDGQYSLPLFFALKENELLREYLRNKRGDRADGNPLEKFDFKVISSNEETGVLTFKVRKLNPEGKIISKDAQILDKEDDLNFDAGKLITVRNFPKLDPKKLPEYYYFILGVYRELPIDQLIEQNEYSKEFKDYLSDLKSKTASDAVENLDKLYATVDIANIFSTNHKIPTINTLAKTLKSDSRYKIELQTAQDEADSKPYNNDEGYVVVNFLISKTENNQTIYYSVSWDYENMKPIIKEESDKSKVEDGFLYLHKFKTEENSN